tara:strand:+ start:2269 stop:3366 length:1098 start_codon:yes stop_codon:yes gene_type:complete
MNFRHLIIPGSFFPSLGGAQGSMLNFVQLLGNKKLIHVALGLRGFKYSAFKKRQFSLTFPYLGKLLNIDFYVVLILFLYKVLYKPDIIWLYGGGIFSAKVLKYRWIFNKKVKFVLRSAGEDIQRDKIVNYGYDDESSERSLILDFYPKADFFWSLGDEITSEYLSLGIKKHKIIQTGNLVIRPIDVDQQYNFADERIKIGVIGRYHPKKQFELAKDVVKIDKDKKYKFHFKTPGFFFNADTNHAEFHDGSAVNEMINWPPIDVWNFYNKCDILLITSRIESFGNVTFEAGLSGLVILIQKDVTGGKLARELGFKVYTYDNFESKSIIKGIKEIEKNESNITRKKIYKDSLFSKELKSLIERVSNA